jgi:hypothetical protein
MVQNPLESNNHLDGKEFTRLLWDAKFITMFTRASTLF